MKIPEWLPDTRQPVRPEGGAPMPMIARLTDPFIRFFHVEAAGGLVLLACTIVALALANSPWSAAVASFWQIPAGFDLGGIGIHMSLLLWINDGLMTVFFFLAAGGFGITLLCRWLGVRAIAIYGVIGAGTWLAVLKSGVHSTVAGVLLGLLTPSRPWLAERSLLQVLGVARERLLQDHAGGQELEHHEEAARLLGNTARETISPLDRLETALHPWVAFAIMPVFALANAGVHLNLPDLADPVVIAVAVGLVLGKPLGIVGFSAVAVKLGLAKLPDGVSWKVMAGAGCLAGIGFTMSLFIGGLALDGTLLDAGKIGTLAGSAFSAVLGSTLLWWFLKKGVAGGDVN